MNTVTIAFDTSIDKYVARYKGKILARSHDSEYLVNRVNEGNHRKFVKNNITKYELVSAHSVHAGFLPTVDPTNTSEETNVEFSINERFEFAEQLTRMIIAKGIPSIVLTGLPGIGKTYTIIKTLKDSGLINTQTTDPDPEEIELARELGDYTIVKGFSTARGLYRTLYENNGKIIIFDDCDSVQKDKTAVDILKGALDSYEERWIHWNSENNNSDLPKNFMFTGQIIFISNLEQHKIDEAIKSRSMCIDLSMTVDQKIERMGFILQSSEFLPEIQLEFKQDALAFITKHKNDAPDISLRTLISISKIRNGQENWEKLALYILTKPEKINPLYFNKN
jgi:hypothetical protein